PHVTAMNQHAERDQSPIEAKLSEAPSAARPSAACPSAARPSAADETGAATSPPPSRLLESRGAVLATLFLVTGALGLPLLWMNKAFSNVERVFWAITVSLYTALLIYVVWRVCAWSYHQIVG
ncbi:MAG: hypothetical protein ACF788_12600, partial [Novipirellula sp. JB048]